MDQQNEKNINLDIENDLKEENKNVAVEDSQIAQEVQKSEEEADSFVSKKSQADEKEGTRVAQGVEDPSQEEKAPDEKVLLSEESPTKYSYTDQPPNDTPKLETSGMPEKSATKRSGKAVWIIVLAIVLAGAILLTFVGGTVVGAILWGRMKNQPLISGGNSQGGKQTFSNYAEVVEAVSASVIEVKGSGSGVVISQNGYIITNQHVVEGLEELIVVLNNGDEYAATYVGGDAKYDVAVLKITPTTELTAAKIGNSEDLKVGEEVLAIGNPLATLGGSVTNGIISAKERKIRVEHYQMTLLQTNAEINPGNSGGGLFNMSGELIGIVNAKSFATGIEGLGFAIPIDIAWHCAEDIMEYGYVTNKPYIGIGLSEEKPANGYPNGVYITASTNDRLKVRDRIIEINGNSVSTLADIYPVTDTMQIGDKIKMKVSRWNGSSFETHDLTITVVEYQPQE